MNNKDQIQTLINGFKPNPEFQYPHDELIDKLHLIISFAIEINRENKQERYIHAIERLQHTLGKEAEWCKFNFKMITKENILVYHYNSFLSDYNKSVDSLVNHVVSDSFVFTE